MTNHVYAVEINDKLSQEAFADLKDAQKFMTKRAQHMNTCDFIDPNIYDMWAEYFYIPKNDIYDPFKEGYIRIIDLEVK